MSAESLSRFLTAKMEQFADWSPDHGVNCAILAGEPSPKVDRTAYFGIFDETRELEGGVVFAPLTRGADIGYPAYRARLLNLNPYSEPKISIPTIRNKDFAQRVHEHLREIGLPRSLFVFGRDAQTKSRVLAFYYPWGMEIRQALLDFQVNLRSLVAKEN